MTPNLSLEILFTMLAAVAGGALAKKLRLPLIVGYLLAGVVIGAAFRFRFGNGEITPILAELGVALLLFSIGLEFPVRRLSKVGRPGVLGAVVQMLLTIVASLLIFTVFFNFSLFKALFFGSLLALSSTAVIVKTLEEHGALETAHGELMVTWLLIQDLAVIPLLIIFSAGALDGSAILNILQALLKAITLLGLVMLLGIRFVPSVFSKLAFLGSRELLTIAAMATCVAFSVLTNTLGISLAAGAFLAGLLLSSADLSHEIYALVRPLRDLFAAVFFVSLGFLVEPITLATNALLIALLLVVALALKFAISYGVGLFLGYHHRVVFTSALGLSTIGEFAFVLAAAGLAGEQITPEFYQVILAVVVLSLVLAPLCFANASGLYGWWKLLVDKSDKTPNLAMPRQAVAAGHIVLIGYGRVGREVAEALEAAGTSFVVVDYNLHTLKEARRRGYSYVYGDPTEESVLAAANLATARAVVLAVPDTQAEELIIKEARRVNSAIKIYCRAHTKADADFLHQFGVTAVVEPEIEAAKALIARL
jgi:CPA2 family monovalent cation:H+ antiporter-2